MFEQEQANRNLSTAGHWQLFRGHREKMMRILTDIPAEEVTSLCLVGAGNANDVDLDVLTEYFQSIHLADCDPAALVRAAERCRPQTRSKLVLQGDVQLLPPSIVNGDYVNGDHVNGDHVNNLPRDATQLCQVLQTTPGPRLGGPFDVVVSCCVISQLVDSLQQLLEPQSPDLVSVAVEARNAHLRLLCDQLQPNGYGVIVSDFLSSWSFPPLASLSEADFPRAMAEQIAQHNFFTATNPFAIQRFLNADCQDRVDRVAVSPPWRWNLGSRWMAVAAVLFRRRC